MKKIILCTVVLLLSASGIGAYEAQDVVGSWILDREKTEENIRQSPEWDETVEKMLPMILTKMERIKYTYTDDTITILKGENEQVLNYTISSSSGDNPVVLEVSINDQTMNLDITFLSKNQVNMKSSTTDDMDYYVWKRSE